MMTVPPNVTSLTVALHSVEGALPVPYYLPGKTITGSVFLEVDQDLKEYEYFTVTIHGKASVTISFENRRSTYSDIEILLNQSFPLLPVEPKKAKIPKGLNAYPFQFVLPHGLPCSFNSDNGIINYEITTELKLTPETTEDISSQIEFFVNPGLDFNYTNKSKLFNEFGVYDEVFEYEMVNTSSCSCSAKAKLLTMSLFLPKRFFVRGEFASFKVIVDNRLTSVRVSFLRMELLRRLTFKGAVVGVVDDDTQWHKEPTKDQKSEDAILLQMLGPQIAPKAIHAWEVNDFVIPKFEDVQVPLLPTGLGGNLRCIDMAYALHFLASFQEGCCSKYRSVDVFIPIMIGNVPLKAVPILKRSSSVSNISSVHSLK